jgi:formylglycine-generating enzyme
MARRRTGARAITLLFALALAACDGILGLGSLHSGPEPDGGSGSGADAGDATVASDTGADAPTKSDGPVVDAGEGEGASADTGATDSGTDATQGGDAASDAGGLVDATSPDSAPPDSGTPPTSCTASATGTGNDCGGLGGTTNCCASVLVQGGSQFQTTVLDAGYSTTVSDFRFDAFEVTVGRFRAFVKALGDGIAGWTASSGALSPPTGAGKHTYLHNGNGLLDSHSGGYESGWQSGWPAMPTSSATWTTNLSACTSTFDTWNAADDALPISCVTWYEAYAFCIWDGGFLPSVSEFNYAYIGGANEWTYPWGNSTPTSSLAVYKPGFTGSGAYNGIAPVGSVPAGKALWGQYDLAGNLWEWVLDAADTPSTTQSCSDCADTNAAQGDRIIRGGDFDDDIVSLSASNTTSDSPTSAFGNYGFRCARAP